MPLHRLAAATQEQEEVGSTPRELEDWSVEELASFVSRLEDDWLLRPDGTRARIEHSGTGNHRHLSARIQRRRQGWVLDHQQPDPNEREILAGNPGTNGKCELLLGHNRRRLTIGGALTFEISNFV